MKQSIVLIAAAALASLASAGSFHDRRAGHAAFHAIKREASPSSVEQVSSTVNGTDCVSCTTVYTTWFGEAALVPEPTPTSTSSPSSTPTPEPSTTSVAPPPPPPPPPPASSSSSAAPSPSAAPATNDNKAQQESQPASGSSGSKSGSGSSSGSSSSSAQIATGGSLYAMAYTPYKTDNGKSRCASAQEVSSDISSIASKGFKTVRAYATDCDGLVNIANACKASGLKMIVGIFVDEGGVSSHDVAGQISDIKNYFAGDYSIVEMVLLGNEALFNNFATGSQLASAIQSLKRELKSAGYSGPVSTADTVAGLQANQGALCDSMDLLAANIHPFFNDAVSAVSAGGFVSSQLSILQGLCGGSKKAINSETGWPSDGSSNGMAIPSAAEQLLAIQSIKAAVGGDSVFFSFQNDYWKGSGYLGVESHWGCASLFSN